MLLGKLRSKGSMNATLECKRGRREKILLITSPAKLGHFEFATQNLFSILSCCVIKMIEQLVVNLWSLLYA